MQEAFLSLFALSRRGMWQPDHSSKLFNPEPFSSKMWRNLKTVGFALFLAISRSWAADIPVEDGVLVLTPDNFEAAVAENPALLVEFYAPWCGHCKRLAPEYAKAAEELAKDGLKIAKVDADAHRELGQEYGVSGFPTLKFLKDGKVLDYVGGRTTDDIVQYVRKKSGPPAKTLLTAEEAKGFEGEAEAVAIGLFANVESDQAKAYLGVAGDIDRLPFAIASGEELRAVYGASEGDKVVVVKRYDEGKSTLDVTSATTEAEIEQFVQTYSMRLVTTFDAGTSASIFGGPIKIHMLFMANAEDETFQAQLAMITKSAEKLRGKMLHVHVPHTEERVLNYFGASSDKLPMVVVADMSSGSGIKKYILEGGFTSESLLEFGDKFYAGTLTPHLKSEEPTEEDIAEPVKVVKGKSFNKLVLENDKDVLVEFYAPWCGHCKALAPKYDELAEKLEGVSSVVISKMDATENEIDVEGVNVMGFPTLYFFPGKAKGTPIQYEGAREVDDLAAFIKEKASTPFELEEADKEAEEKEEPHDEL